MKKQKGRFPKKSSFFGTPDWIRTSGLQSRSYQAVNAGTLMPQGSSSFAQISRKNEANLEAVAAQWLPVFFVSFKTVVK